MYPVQIRDHGSCKDEYRLSESEARSRKIIPPAMFILVHFNQPVCDGRKRIKRCLSLDEHFQEVVLSAGR